MAQAVICPVCAGIGKVIDPDSLDSSASRKTTCHGCHGRGWVEVGHTAVMPPPWEPWYIEPWKPRGDYTGVPETTTCQARRP